ncbi:MAG TPA: LLM class flavin-dependent oxidoreductase [Dehalococcoidia bacterium]|nr:LLM class flavin-dependent oxidoreductase [Dehalococcoidia bacterium]
MKFHWFHLMPYRYLPPDFPQRYRSIWVDIPSQLYDPVKGHALYNEYLDDLEYADQAGFDGICVNEHHQNGYGLMPSPNLMAAALTRRTRNANLVVMGNSIALYNPPIRVAEEMAMLDVMSGGRLVAGFPLGTAMDTTFGYGVPPAVLRDRYHEAHNLIVQAWTRPDPFTFNGKYTKLRYVNVWPRPLQKPHPPIWVPGAGTLETWEWVAEMGYVYLYLSYFGHKRGREVMDGYWEFVDRYGGDTNPYRAGFLQVIAVSETDASAEEEYAEHALFFYNTCLHVYPGFADPPGYRTLRTLKASGFSGLAASARPFGQLGWKDLVERGYVVAGSPASVRDQLREVIKNLRVGHLLLLLHFGSMPHHLTLKNTDLFAREVMPHLRDLWSEHEDRWSPVPLPAEERVQPGAAAQGLRSEV